MYAHHHNDIGAKYIVLKKTIKEIIGKQEQDTHQEKSQGT